MDIGQTFSEGFEPIQNPHNSQAMSTPPRARYMPNTNQASDGIPAFPHSHLYSPIRSTQEQTQQNIPTQPTRFFHSSLMNQCLAYVQQYCDARYFEAQLSGISQYTAESREKIGLNILINAMIQQFDQLQPPYPNWVYLRDYLYHLTVHLCDPRSSFQSGCQTIFGICANSISEHKNQTLDFFTQAGLLSHEIDTAGLNHYGEALAHVAAKNRNAHALDILMACGLDLTSRDKDNRVPLFHALKSRDHETIYYLLPTESAFLEWPKGICHLDNEGNSALHLAIETRDITLVNLVCKESELNYGVFKNIAGDYPIHRAVLCCDPKSTIDTHIFSAVLDHCDEDTINKTDDKHNTPLLLSIQKRKDVFCKKLLEKGANYDITNDRFRAPLEYALFNKLFDILDLIVKQMDDDYDYIEFRPTHPKDVITACGLLPILEHLELQQEDDSKYCFVFKHLVEEENYRDAFCEPLPLDAVAKYNSLSKAKFGKDPKISDQDLQRKLSTKFIQISMNDFRQQHAAFLSGYWDLYPNLRHHEITLNIGEEYETIKNNLWPIFVSMIVQFEYRGETGIDAGALTRQIVEKGTKQWVDKDFSYCTNQSRNAASKLFENSNQAESKQLVPVELKTPEIRKGLRQEFFLFGQFLAAVLLQKNAVIGNYFNYAFFRILVEMGREINNSIGIITTSGYTERSVLVQNWDVENFLIQMCDQNPTEIIRWLELSSENERGRTPTIHRGTPPPELNAAMLLKIYAFNLEEDDTYKKELALQILKLFSYSGLISEEESSTNNPVALVSQKIEEFTFPNSEDEIKKSLKDLALSQLLGHAYLYLGMLPFHVERLIQKLGAKGVQLATCGFPEVRENMKSALESGKLQKLFDAGNDEMKIANIERLYASVENYIHSEETTNNDLEMLCGHWTGSQNIPPSEKLYVIAHLERHEYILSTACFFQLKIPEAWTTGEPISREKFDQKMKESVKSTEKTFSDRRMDDS